MMEQKSHSKRFGSMLIAMILFCWLACRQSWRKHNRRPRPGKRRLLQASGGRASAPASSSSRSASRSLRICHDRFWLQLRDD